VIADLAIRHRRVLTVFSAALAVRLVFNLGLHPPLDYVFSDMAGYLGRAARLFDQAPGVVDPYSTFYPFGTHYLVALIQALFGRESRHAIGVVFAALGAGAVAYAFATAARLCPSRPRLLAVYAALLVLHVPHVMLGGFVLSEIPFAFALAASVFHLVRHDTTGSMGDAAMAGVALAVGATLRPQAAVSVAILALVFALRRGRRPGPAPARLSASSVLAFAAPIALVVTFGALRAQHHVGRYAFISTNGAFNLAIGRCHASRLSATKTPHSAFEAPSLKHLETFKDKHGIEPLIALDPALGPTVKIDAEVWDEAAARRKAAECVRATGALRQLKYSASHVVLMYLYNLPWPTRGALANVWAGLQLAWIPGALVGLARGATRPRSSEALVAAQGWALLLVAMVFFGEARLRVPYDPFLMWMALAAYAPIAERLYARLRRRPR
jgi:hypothetical protein